MNSTAVMCWLAEFWLVRQQTFGYK